MASAKDELEALLNPTATPAASSGSVATTAPSVSKTVEPSVASSASSRSIRGQNADRDDNDLFQGQFSRRPQEPLKLAALENLVTPPKRLMLQNSQGLQSQGDAETQSVGAHTEASESTAQSARPDDKSARNEDGIKGLKEAIRREAGTMLDASVQTSLVEALVSENIDSAGLFC